MSPMKPMDPAFPIERQIGLDVAHVVLVNVFLLDPADEAVFRAAWEDDAGFMKRQPGFISTQLHRAIGESFAYMNYAFMHPEFRAKLSAYPTSAVASPHLFQKIAVPNVCTL